MNYLHICVVGAGIARPTPVYDTVQSQGIVTAGMGRAMPAPTINSCVKKGRPICHSRPLLNFNY
ncbi:MAG: hypothetical protein FWD97_05650 [Defluviitaleaceae bacterium]|nr:hypothetical protein [Defluviitaleaceae bacterium]